MKLDKILYGKTNLPDAKNMKQKISETSQLLVTYESMYLIDSQFLFETPVAFG
jgi:hypothetical protein